MFKTILIALDGTPEAEAVVPVARALARARYAGLVLDEAAALAALSSIAALARLLPERDPHPNLFEITLFVLGYLDEPEVWPALLVRWELALLEDLGFGLDLTACAATGARQNLIYVSPKSGRAVSAAAGEPYKDRLLALPQFLIGSPDRGVTATDVALGLKLTEHFLLARVLRPRDLSMPEARNRLLSYLRPNV